MTQEEFIEVLNQERYPYEIEWDKIIVNNEDTVYLSALTSLPPDVEFKNGGNVFLNALTSLSPGMEFMNGGNVYLESLTSLPPGVVFNNGEDVKLDSLIGGWLVEWKGNIEGIDSNMLLNLMINKGVFER